MACPTSWWPSCAASPARRRAPPPLFPRPRRKDTSAMTKILLVEDHEELWDFLSRRLKRRGFEVVLAHDGQQGVDVARSERPDVILLDMNLPVMDGWTAARTLRGQEET